MATCKDCIYYTVCNYKMWCDLFKDKTDFVEVVHCKDCWKRYKHCFDKTLEDNDYCSYGEREIN